MNTILKAIVSLVVTAFVPVVESSLLFVLFLAIIVLFPNTKPPFDLGYLGALAGFLLVAFVSLLLGFLISLVYTFLLGLPALLVGWYLRAIRWWTTLIVAFLIATIIAASSILPSPIGQPKGTPLWRSTDPADLVFAGSSILTLGMIGLSCGLVFWLLWRYWVMPGSPAGRPRPVEIQPAVLHDGTDHSFGSRGDFTPSQGDTQDGSVEIGAN